MTLSGIDNELIKFAISHLMFLLWERRFLLSNLSILNMDIRKYLTFFPVWSLLVTSKQIIKSTIFGRLKEKNDELVKTGYDYPLSTKLSLYYFLNNDNKKLFTVPSLVSFSFCLLLDVQELFMSSREMFDAQVI